MTALLAALLPQAHAAELELGAAMINQFAPQDATGVGVDVGVGLSRTLAVRAAGGVYLSDVTDGLVSAVAFLASDSSAEGSGLLFPTEKGYGRLLLDYDFGAERPAEGWGAVLHLYSGLGVAAVEQSRAILDEAAFASGSAGAVVLEPVGSGMVPELVVGFGVEAWANAKVALRLQALAAVRSRPGYAADGDEASGESGLYVDASQSLGVQLAL